MWCQARIASRVNNGANPRCQAVQHYHEKLCSPHRAQLRGGLAACCPPAPEDLKGAEAGLQRWAAAHPNFPAVAHSKLATADHTQSESDPLGTSLGSLMWRQTKFHHFH